MEKIDVKDLMDQRYQYWTKKKTLGLEKSLDFYCVYRYLNARDDAPSEFIDDVFSWAHTDYNVNKFLGTLDIDWNINRKPAIQLNSTNVYDFLEAIEQQYPKHVKKRAMEARAKSLKKAYDAWLDEHSPQLKMSLSAVASALDNAGIHYKFVKASPAFTVEVLEQAIADLKKTVINLSKSKKSEAGSLRDKFSSNVEKIRGVCYALFKSESEDSDLPKLQAFSKDFLVMAQALFKQPSLSQLSDANLKRYYSKESLFRASSRNDAKRIASSDNIEDALSSIDAAAYGLLTRDTQLLNMSQDFDF